MPAEGAGCDLSTYRAEEENNMKNLYSTKELQRNGDGAPTSGVENFATLGLEAASVVIRAFRQM